MTLLALRQQALTSFLLLTSLVICHTAFIELSNPKICTPYVGCVQGKYMPGYQTERFEAFLGIPYALPPVGELRFSNPKSHPRWWNVLNATEAKADCIQKNYLIPNPVVYGEEDCLYLNIYRPIQHLAKKLPVMVYIYGGGFFSGSAHPLILGPEYFMDTEEVILVTFAYRLGPLGFLSTNDVNMPGNFGLKDQNLALRWVNKNIAYFGGNPKMITLFGESAGGVATHLHILSKQSEGLFRNAIVMSGTANVPFTINAEPLEQARKMAELCNVTNVNELSTAKLTRALRNVDAATFVNAGDGLKYWDVDYLTNFRPVVENAENIDASEAFLTEHPAKSLAEGKYTPVPWLTTFVPHEGAVRVLAILANEKLKSSFNSRFDYLLEKLLEWPEHFNQANLIEKMQTIKEEYFAGQSEINDETAQGFMDLITDRGFHNALFNAIHTYVNTVNTERYPIYLYKFNYDGPKTHTFANVYTSGANMKHYGVVHCDDLIYLFRSPLLFKDFDKNSTEAAVIKDYVNSFVHFAKFSKTPYADTQEPCNNSTFNSAAETICDYNEFKNDPSTGSYQIVVDNKFNVRRAKLWNTLLQYSKE